MKLRQFGLAGLSLLFLCCQASAQENGRMSLAAASFASRHPLDLSRNWRFQAGDDRRWADPAFDDRAWPLADTDLGGNPWSGIGWFRLHLAVAPDLAGTRLGLLYHHLGAAQIYLDGEPIHTFGTVSAEPDSEKAFHAHDLQPLPLELAPGHHLLAVRYSNHRAAVQTRLGMKPGFTAHLALWSAELEKLPRVHARFQMFFTGVPLAFFLLHLLLFIFYPPFRANLYYAFHTLCIAAVSYLVFEQQVAPMDEYLRVSLLSRLPMVLASVTGLLFIYTLFYQRLPRRFWIFLATGLGLGVWSLNAHINYVYLFILLSLSEWLRVVVWALWRRQPGACIVGAGALIFVTAVGYQMLLLLGIIGHLGPFSYVYVWGVLALILSMSVYLARTFGQTHQEVEAQLAQVRALSAELERKVDERTRELQHKNVELEERNAELRQTQAQLIMQEKMASLGNLVAGVAHELNTPVGAVKSAVDVAGRCLARIVAGLESGPDLESLRARVPFQRAVELLGENHRIASLASERIAGIVRSLRTFARLDETELQEVDIHEGLESTLTLLGHELKDRIEVVRAYGELPLLRCYPGELNQVFMNLLVNAIQAVGSRGRIEIRTWREGGQALVQIADDGTGIPPEHLERIFDPGFTTKGVQVGTGLGLSITYNIVRKHRGSIRARNRLEGGAVFTVELPLDPEEGGT